MNNFQHHFIFHWVIWLLLFVLFSVCAIIIFFVVQEQEYMRNAKLKKNLSTGVYYPRQQDKEICEKRQFP